MTARRIVFGLVVPGGDAARAEQEELPARVDRLTALLGEEADVTFERRDAPSYEALAADVREARVDLAWLPPIVFVRLGDDAVPLGSVVRDGKSTYEAALVVRADSKVTTIEGLRGTRAGWVDPWSAAGFVLPRVKLALLGVDPRTVFRAEMFHGSHRAAIEALVSGRCDVVGTYARADEDGAVTAGAWSEVEGADVRVVATFGAIPPDVVAVRRGLPSEVRSAIASAVRGGASKPAARALLREIFGGDELREGLAPGYDALRHALTMASARGLFD